MDELKEMLREMLKEDELFDLGAQLLKKTYDSLIKTGFTEEQATQIVAGQGLAIKGQ